MAAVSPVTLLGPQRLGPTLSGVLADLGITGPVAAVTAGWQEREDEDGELFEHLGPGSVNLGLYRRTLAAMGDDPELDAAIHDRQTRLRELQDLYRIRLGHALDAVRALERRGDDPLASGAAADAMAAVQSLDLQHLDRIREVHVEFEATWRPGERAAVARERGSMAAELGRCEAVALAGGHVAVLLNRLRLFDFAGLLGGRPVIAWSAGAMAAGNRIVLFHDAPPQGAGYAEVLESGLGLYPGLVPFPHAKRRLRLDDPARVRLLSRRFIPDRCVTLNEGDRVDWSPEAGWATRAGTLRRLALDGSLEPAGAP